ncbi:bacteriocin [Chryseobacterium sp. G0186]|nr:bacteriocin [Chryseobacterium sp. G0186]
MHNFLSPPIELFKIKCNLAYNQIKIIMKKSDIQQKKLTKKALKNINGGGGPDICIEGFCMDREFNEIRLGLLDRNGYCC